MKIKYFLLIAFLLTFSVLFGQLKENENRALPEKTAITKTAAPAVSKSVAPNGTYSTTAAAAYDFTTGANKYYGGSAGAVEVEPGVWAMVAGDVNQDGQITSLDYDVWVPNAKSATTGYIGSDINMDGQNTSLDYDIWLPNAKSAKTSQVPN